MNITINVTKSGGGNWKSYGATVGAAAWVVGTNCFNQVSPANGTYVRSFTTVVPATAGTYNILFGTFTNTNCGGAGGALTWTGAIVVKSNQTITFGAQAAQTYSPGGTFAISPLATASSGLPVAYSSLTPAVCTVAGTTVTMVAAGTCTIAADQAGNASYYPAPQVTQNVTINPASSLDHIAIEHGSGQGVTCTPNTLTIKACQDAACSVLYAGGVTGTLTATGTPTVVWTGGTGFSIGVSGSTTKDVQVTTPGSVVFGTQTGSVAPVPAAATTCNFGAPSCTFASADAGLLFDVPHHVSETLQNITVSAVKKADNSLACVPAFGSVSKNVAFTCSYANPASGTLPVRVGGQALNAGNNAGAACDGTGQTLSLAFDASGVAGTTVQYADVGSLTLSAQYSGSGADAGLVMTGTDTFIAAPATFAFSAITAAPIKAGASFSATIMAKNSAGNTVPNFGQEGEGVTLTHTRYQPTGAGASDGTFSGSAGPFSSGAATASDLIWSEVGTIDLTATLTSGNYLGSGLSATGSTGAAGAAGPFVPDHFETLVTQGCSAGSFTYSGQPFTVQVKAMNGVITPAVTVNYDGTAGTSPNFAKAVTLSDANAAGVGTLAPAAVAASDFVAGVATVTTPAYTFTSRQTVQTTIKLRATDADASSSGFAEGTADIRSGRAKIGNAHGSELLNLPIPFRTEYWNSGWMPHAADSCTGDVTLGAGNTVSVTLTSPPSTCVQDSGNPGLSGSGCAIAAPVVQRFREGATPGVGFAGNFNLWLKAPGAGNTGAVTVTGNVPSWLQYPWTGGADINPSGRATFGVYKGANEFIYMRENY